MYFTHPTHRALVGDSRGDPDSRTTSAFLDGSHHMSLILGHLQARIVLASNCTKSKSKQTYILYCIVSGIQTEYYSRGGPSAESQPCGAHLSMTWRSTYFKTPNPAVFGDKGSNHPDHLINGGKVFYHPKSSAHKSIRIDAKPRGS